MDLEHLHLILPVITSVIPIGITTRSVRATIAEILTRNSFKHLRLKGSKRAGSIHVAMNAAPTVLAVSDSNRLFVRRVYLVETVFSWPGTGFLLNDAIFRRDIPLLQGVILY